MFNKWKKFIIAVAIQVAILFSIIIFKFLILSGGAEVYLRMEPVDPRDPFRGDYVTFRYDISTLDGVFFDSEEKIKKGDYIYVPLEKDGRFWDLAGKVTKKMPAGGIFIKGVVENVDYAGDFLEEAQALYGIEEFFIPENSGRDLRFDDGLTLVSIGPKGDPVLKQIYINGKPWPAKDPISSGKEESSEDEKVFLKEEISKDTHSSASGHTPVVLTKEKITDPAGFYQFVKPDGWRIRSSSGTPGGGLASQVILETNNFSSTMISSDGVYKKKYTAGATLNISVVNGEREPDHDNAQIFENYRITMDDYMIGDFHRFSEPVFLGELRDAHVNFQGKHIIIRYAHDPANFPSGEDIFKEILKSFEFISG
ncbi:hypothetical protein C4572_00755 [Candidatus Parcubacteria bacterium]|nr:MAG: hypothetical protein C4572_00755 [Candidatus Parcubacteria bacterium]